MGSPTSSPTSSPTTSPTTVPTDSRTSNPTESPTVRPTLRPTARFTQFAQSDDENDDIRYPENPAECPEDIRVVHHDGVTNLPDDAIRIVSQDSSTVTVQLVQAYTNSSSAVGSWYYQYQQSTFSNKCYGDTDVEGEYIEEITIQCL